MVYSINTVCIRPVLDNFLVRVVDIFERIDTTINPLCEDEIMRVRKHIIVGPYW
jgi:hypothetical protein